MATAAAFLLMLISHPGNSLSLTKLRSFPTEATCTTAAKAIVSALGNTNEVEIGCVPLSAFESLRQQVR